MAGNQLGKTYSGAAEAAYHLTGLSIQLTGREGCSRSPYRPGRGQRRWKSHATACSACCVGPPRIEFEWGTGLIPADKILDTNRKQGVADALDSVVVKHVSGETSVLGFKAYDQGRTKWQGETLDFVWFDEEPPYDIYMEGLTRTNATGGLVYLTFTPLKGVSDVVHSFLHGTVLPGSPPSRDGMKNKNVTQMTIEDAEHYTPEQRQAIIDSYPEHERDARIKGIPSMGSGRVFPIKEDDILVAPFAVPKHWFQIVGVDFGWDHPFAASRCAWDKDNDIWYVVSSYRESKTTPPIHAAAIKPWGEWIPCAWPHDGLQHDKGSGEELAAIYKKQGLKMLDEKATHTDGGIGIEAGITEMLTRMQTGRFKVFRGNDQWIEEFRYYRREDGLIVKERDDLISSSRYAIMMRRSARQAPSVERWKPKPRYSGWAA